MSVLHVEDGLRSRLADELVDTGRYHELQQFVRQQLSQEGWYDDVGKLVNRAISEGEMTGAFPSFEKVTLKVEKNAIGLVSSTTNKKIYDACQQHLEALLATDKSR